MLSEMSNTTNEDVQKLIDGLCAQQKLLRDRGLAQLKTTLSDLSVKAIQSLLTNLVSIIESGERFVYCDFL